MADTVYIGCKIPNGVIISVAGKTATLKGANSSQLIGGFGVTEVDGDLWEQWSKDNEGHDLLKSNLVFVQTTAARANAEAKEKSEVNSGFEPLAPAPNKETTVPAERR